jgi:hypothetical protein
VDAGGVQLLLTLPSNKHTYAGLSYAFFGLASIPLAFERVVRNPGPRIPPTSQTAAVALHAVSCYSVPRCRWRSCGTCRR